MLHKALFFPLSFLLLLNGCADTSQWRTYINEDLGFSLVVPREILHANDPEAGLVPLHIFEEGESVYFSSHSLEKTLSEQSWDFRIGGKKLENEDGILPFLENYYAVQGCTIEMNPDATGAVFRVHLSAKNPDLMPDDPFACFVGGKVSVFYTPNSGKILTYQVLDQFFHLPSGPISEETLASLEFPLN